MKFLNLPILLILLAVCIGCTTWAVSVATPHRVVSMCACIFALSEVLVEQVLVHGKVSSSPTKSIALSVELAAVCTRSR